MDGFKRPQRPAPRPRSLGAHQASPELSGERPSSQLPPVMSPSTVSQTDMDSSMQEVNNPVTPRKSPVRWTRRRIICLVIVAVLLLASVIGAVWYRAQLKPVNPTDTSVQRVVIKEGTGFSYVAARLKERGLIRNVTAFNALALLTGKRSDIKEGTCSLNPSESAAEILGKLTSGCDDFKSITFFPGATIEKPLYKPAHAELDDTMNIKSVLARASYSDSDIAAALSKQYTGPLFQGKPAGSSLEGYIYGETYYVDTTATAEQVLQKTFDQMYKEVEPLIPSYQQRGLNLYQAITLASIIQRELNCEGKPEDRRLRCQGFQETIAQIFLKRLAENISLGSDVTFIYAADMMKVAPSVNIDSPYNTRVHTGLPPGPIAAPGPSALRALAHPSNTDYLYFIAGDDGMIYFAKTQAEHEANIKNHCQQLCNEL